MPPVPTRKVIVPQEVTEEGTLVVTPTKSVVRPLPLSSLSNQPSDGRTCFDIPVPGSNGYETRLIHVICMNSTTSTIKARCLGNLAVHKGLSNDGGWAVTHIPIQLTIVNLANEQDALKLGRYLWENLRKTMLETTITGFLSKTPKWLSVWCKAMREQKKWLDPQSFKEAK